MKLKAEGHVRRNLSEGFIKTFNLYNNDTKTSLCASFAPLYLSVSDGYNAWRDCLKPSELLSKLCRDNGLEDPLFSPGRITVAEKVFTGKTLFMNEGQDWTHTALGLPFSIYKHYINSK